MTEKTKRFLYGSIYDADEWSFRGAAIIALEDFASESGHLLSPEASTALQKLIREFDEAGPACAALDDEANGGDG